MNNKIVAMLSVALMIGLSGVGSIITPTVEAGADPIYYNLDINVNYLGDGPFDQGDPIYFDGDVYNNGDDYPGTYHCQMWIEKWDGTFETYILDEYHSDLDESCQDDLDPNDWTPTEAGWYRVVGKVTYGQTYDMDYCTCFYVRYFQNN